MAQRVRASGALADATRAGTLRRGATATMAAVTAAPAPPLQPGRAREKLLTPAECPFGSGWGSVQQAGEDFAHDTFELAELVPAGHAEIGRAHVCTPVT